MQPRFQTVKQQSSCLKSLKFAFHRIYLVLPGQGVRPFDPLSLPLPRSLHPCQHQRTNGVIHHRLVVDGQQLFANALGNRVKPRAGPAGEYDAFHVISFFLFLKRWPAVIEHLCFHTSYKRSAEIPPLKLGQFEVCGVSCYPIAAPLARKSGVAYYFFLSVTICLYIAAYFGC